MFRKQFSASDGCMWQRKLLATTIDGGRNDSAAVLKTYIIPLKNADASDMSSVIKDVYKSAMATTGSSQQVGGFPFGRRWSEWNSLCCCWRIT